MSFSRRSEKPEIMDTESDSTSISLALSELKLINILLGGNNITRQALHLVKRKYRLNSLRVLDAGSGSSDILLQKNLRKFTDVISIDRNKITCGINKAKGNIKDIVCGNVLAMPFSKGSVDVVHSSLFLHHFNSDVIISVLQEFCETARFAVIINDLQRSRIAYYGFGIISFLLSESSLVRNDGLVSVQRSFKRKEIKSFLDQTGYRYSLKWKWAFRWSVIIFCDEKI